MAKQATPLQERLMARVRVDAAGCWVWVGPVNFGGYGRITLNGKTAMVHRLLYEHHAGPIPAGLQLDHLCRNRPCCNPQHLEPVTSRENSLRGIGPAAMHAAQVNCVNGHPLTPDNLLRESGKRRCRECNKARCRKASARRRAVKP